ncbi:MAG: AraC family transcriptional regulator [Flavobacteriales bacterium]|nr:MAG: AraC family transcriptional regulator [Flavobacteriales bacterium]
MIIENNVEGIKIESGFTALTYDNDNRESVRLTRDIDSTCIQIHFCLQTQAKLFFNRGKYNIDIPPNRSLLLYNPNQRLPMDVELLPGTRIISILISIEKLHTFFTPEAGIIHFLSEDNKDKKYYSEKSISSKEQVILNQLLTYSTPSNMNNLYIKAKVYELLSVYFQPENNDTQNCPFLEEEENVEKIKKAKAIIIERMAEPPTLAELAQEVDLPLHYLKDGFKQIYGETAFTFLWEYKMEYARRKLETKKYNVSEIGYKLGYSTPSHFIAAFKKKYGITPKKYMGKIS